MDRNELRRVDYSLSEDQVALQDAYRAFFGKNCPIDTVRAAEGSGFDNDLWQRLCATGAMSMAVPLTVGGDGATLVDLVLVAEEAGRSLAPVPWIDHVCATRVLAALDALHGADSGEKISGRHRVAMDFQLRPREGPLLIASAAVADSVIIRQGDDIVLLTFHDRPVMVGNIAGLPMAWINPLQADTRTVLGRGAAAMASYQRGLREWRLLTAAALVGLVESALCLAVDFAKTRYTLGVPIGTLQAISHPLANIAITIEGGRNLARRAAWFLDNEPDECRELALAAFVFMAEEAAKAATMAVHVHGGLGVSTEAPVTAHLVRARGWALAGGDPGATAALVGRTMGADNNCNRGN